MSRLKLLIASGALALAGCGAPDEDEASAARNAAAGSKAENGQLTVRAEGVDLKIDIPAPLRRMAGDRYSALLYPGAVVAGGGQGDRFHSDAAPERVARWYRERARASRFTVATVEREGPAVVLTGATRSGDRLRVRLTPGAGGGTDGRIVVTPRD
jgi:hypothetical protein